MPRHKRIGCIWASSLARPRGRRQAACAKSSVGRRPNLSARLPAYGPGATVIQFCGHQLCGHWIGRWSAVVRSGGQLCGHWIGRCRSVGRQVFSLWAGPVARSLARPVGVRPHRRGMILALLYRLERSGKIRPNHVPPIRRKRHWGPGGAGERLGGGGKAVGRMLSCCAERQQGLHADRRRCQWRCQRT